MSIYEEKPEKPIKEVKKPSDIDRPDRWRECDYGCNIEHSVVYLTGEIDEHTGHEFIARSRTVLLNRPEENQDDPLTVLLDSGGGDAYSMFSIIDFMESLPIKVNITARGRAMSAGAMLLAAATGVRAAGRRTTIMVHEGFTMQQGKSSDIKAASKHMARIEDFCNDMLGEKTKKDSKWWQENTKTDHYMSAEEALELGIIDEII